jgi:hypothetical protein
VEAAANWKATPGASVIPICVSGGRVARLLRRLAGRLETTNSFQGGSMNSSPHVAALHAGQHGGVNVPRLKVRRGDTVDWQFDGPFAIDFQTLSPFDDVFFQGSGSLQQQVRQDAASGSYKYSVAIFDDGQIHLADPEIIVY